MQLEMSSSSIKIWEGMKEQVDFRGELLPQKQYRRRILADVFPIKDNSLTFKTGEIFMNPNEVQWSEDFDKNDDDDWEGKPRISCFVEFIADDEEKELFGSDTDIYFSYHPEGKDEAGFKTSSQLILVVFNSGNIIQSMIENLRNNIRPKLVNLDFGYQKNLELGFGIHRFKKYAWDNSVERNLEINDLSVMYSV